MAAAAALAAVAMLSFALCPASCYIPSFYNRESTRRRVGGGLTVAFMSRAADDGAADDDDVDLTGFNSAQEPLSSGEDAAPPKAAAPDGSRGGSSEDKIFQSSIFEQRPIPEGSLKDLLNEPAKPNEIGKKLRVVFYTGFSILIGAIGVGLAVVDRDMVPIDPSMMN